MADVVINRQQLENELLEVSSLERKKGPKIGSVQIDVSVKETHRTRCDISQHPIEVGSDIADHKRRLPDELSMEGVLSNLPCGLSEGQEAELASARYLDLQSMVDNAEVFDVVTGFRTYTNMMFESFEVSRDQSTGQVIKFSASLKQVEFVGATIVANAVEKNKLAPTANLGPKTPRPASEPVAEESETMFHSLIGGDSGSAKGAAFVGGL